MVPLQQSDEIDNNLTAQVNLARKRYQESPTFENRDEYHRAVRQLADWVLRGQAPSSVSRRRKRVTPHA